MRRLLAGMGIVLAASLSAPARAWTGSATVFQYFLPEDDHLTAGTVKADRGGLHLEGRYNYEAEDAGSLFVGWTFSPPLPEVELTLTPIVGGVFGELSGIAPGLELDLGYKSLGFYVEAEYVHPFDDEEDGFLFAWSELTWTARPWLRAGLVGQRTRLVDTGLDVQRGLFLGFTYRRLDLVGYFFNLGDGDDAFQVAALSYSF